MARALAVALLCPLLSSCAMSVRGFGVDLSWSALDALVEDGNLATSPHGAASALREVFGAECRPDHPPPLEPEPEPAE